MNKWVVAAIIFCTSMAVLVTGSWALYITSPAYREWYDRTSMETMATEMGYVPNGNWLEKEAVIDGSIWTMRWTKDAWYAIDKGGKLDVSVKDSLGSRPCIEVKLVAEARE